MGVNQPLAHRYREVAIKTADPLQLIVILYDGAIQCLQEAQEYLRKRDISSRVRAVNRAVAIISELQASLNLKEGGEIADSLDRLYVYMKGQIFKANYEQKAEPLAEVASLLGNLRSAWGELARQALGEASESASPNLTSAAMLGNSTTGTPALATLNISG